MNNDEYIEEISKKIKAKFKEKREKRKKTKTWQEPRYDEVFYEGLKMLNEDIW